MTPTERDIDKELLEELARIEHIRWSEWQAWCHKVLRDNNPSPEQGDILERWDRQIATPYAELSEAEKQSDRDQVARYLPLIQAHYEKLMLDVIGEDEPNANMASPYQCSYCGIADEPVIRNVFRANLREKLNG
jgi:hypothetical protein